MKMIQGKSMDQEIWVTDPKIVYKGSLWVTLIYHPNFSGVNNLHDMKQTHWTIKYRSLTYIYRCTMDDAQWTKTGHKS